MKNKIFDLKLKLKNDVHIVAGMEGDLYVVKCEELDISGFGKKLIDAFVDLLFSVNFVYNEYVKSDDGDMTKEAIKYRHKLREYLDD